MTGNHYDGGWTSAGIFMFYNLPTMFWVDGSGADEPDAIWNGRWEQATWVDHAASFMNAMCFNVYPVIPDTPLKMNLEMIDSTLEGFVNVPGSASNSRYDGNYLNYAGVLGSWRTRGCRFTRNAGDGTPGQGGISIMSPPGGSLTPTMAFEDSIWTENLSGSGPAIFVYYGQTDLRVRRCFFR